LVIICELPVSILPCTASIPAVEDMNTEEIIVVLVGMESPWALAGSVDATMPEGCW
jgi:hypothetical protein